MIPKIIHYCWFGYNPKPDLVKKCIASWKKYCPDTEIIEWNETNFDVNAVIYTKEAYENKKWAFVSDYVRMYAVCKMGGIYLDTDVELLHSFDALLDCGAFYIFESNVNLNTGLGFGAMKNHLSVQAMLDYYKGRHFVENGKMKLVPCPACNTDSLMAVYPDFKRNGRTQSFADVRIYSIDEYRTFAKNHMAASWVENSDENPEEKVYRDTWLKRFLRKPERIQWVEKHFSKKVFKMYIFCSYDLLEYGLLNYIRRKITRE